MVGRPAILLAPGAHHDEVHEDAIEGESCFRGLLHGSHRGGAVVRLLDDRVGKPSALALQNAPDDLAVERRVVLESSIIHQGPLR